MLFIHRCSGKNVISSHGMNILVSAIGKGFHRVYRNYPRWLPWNNVMYTIYYSCEKMFL